MSELAARTGAINLGQGFPDTDGPSEVSEAAIAAIRDDDFVIQSREHNRQWRSWLATEMGALGNHGVRVIPSAANFLLIRTPDAAQAYASLLSGGVLVRKQDSYFGLQGCIRVTIGTREENDAFLRAAGLSAA